MNDFISQVFNTHQKKYSIARLLSLPVAVLARRKALKVRAQLDVCYQQLFNGVVGGSLEVQIKNFPGSYEINYRSHILRRILEEKQYEPEITDLIKQALDPDKDAVDVGASIGLYTVLLSKALSRGRRVLAIEPTPASLKYLYGNILKNGGSKSVIVYEGIAADRKGRFQLNVIPGMEEYSSLGQIVHESVRNENNIPIRINGDSIDRLVKRHRLAPGLLKIDTEGAEYRVLTGALETLAIHKPVIISELSDRLLSTTNANSRMVVNLLEQNGYTVSSIESHGNQIAYPFEGEIIAIASNAIPRMAGSRT